MMSEVKQDKMPEASNNFWYIAASRTAIIAAVFCLLVLGLLLRDYLHSRSRNPLYSDRMQTLQVQLAGAPRDVQLIAEIRQLDVAMRREYLRNHAFTVTGTYLFLGGFVLFLLAWGGAHSCRTEIPHPDAEIGTVEVSSRGKARWSVAALGLFLGGILVTLVIFSRHDVAAEYVRALATGFPANAAGSATPEDLPVSPVSPATAAPAGKVGAAGAKVIEALPGATHPEQPSIPAGQVNVTPATAIQFPADWAQNWPQFRGPQGVGVVTLAVPTYWDGASGKGIRWKTEAPLPGENSPIHWGPYIFLSGATDKVRAVDCFSADTGKRLWQRAVTLPESAKAEAPKVMDDTGYAAPTMACDGTRIFAIFANGDLACFDFTGKQIWMRNLGRPDSMYGYAASLMLFSGHLIVQYDLGADPDAGKSFLLALNTATGATIWKTMRPVPASWSTPILINTGTQAQIITCANPWVIAYDPLSGQEIWRAQCLGGDVAPSPIYAGGLVFAAVTEAKLVAIRPDGHGDVTKTHIVWSADDGLPDIVSPISNGQVVLLVDSNGALTCYDVVNGKKLWEHAYDDAFRASPLLVDNHFMLLDVTGVMHILDAGRAFKEIGTCALGEATDCTPAVGDGRLYIRGKTHLFCIGAG